MRCPRCDIDYAAGAAFCGQCGVTLVTAMAPAPPQEKASPFAAAAPAPQATAAQEASVEISFGSAAVCLVLIGVVVALFILYWIEGEAFTSRGGLPFWPALGLSGLVLAAGAAAALLVPIPALRLGRRPAVLGLVLLMAAGLGLGLVWSMAPSLVVDFLGSFVLGFGIGLLFPLTFWRQLKRIGPGEVWIPLAFSILAIVVWSGGLVVVFVIVWFIGIMWSFGSEAGLIAVAVVGVGVPWLFGLWRVLVSPVVGARQFGGLFRPPKTSVSSPRREPGQSGHPNRWENL